MMRDRGIERRLTCRLGILCWLLMAGIGGSAAPEPDRVAADEDGIPVFWFPVGEAFRYSLKWGVLPVGEAWMTTGWDELEGRRVLAIRCGARTGRLVAKLFPIENYMETLVDPETFLPVRCHQRLREGRRRRDETTLFFHDEGRVEYTSHLTGETKTIAIGGDTRDLLTLFYVMRRRGMEVEETTAFQVLVDDDVYDLMLTGEALEDVSLSEYGQVRSLRVEPRAKFGAVFVRRGRMWIWMSDDDRRVCVRLSGRVPVASVHAVLRDVSGPGGDRWVK